MRYKGTVTKLQNGDRAGYIGRDTVTRADGQPAELGTDKDVFIHRDDIAQYDWIPLEVGQEFVFNTKPDTRRKDGALRSDSMVLSKFHPVDGGIKLDFPSRVINQPMVPISWTLEPAAFARMEDNPSADWVILVVAQKTGASEKESYERDHVHRTIIGTKNIALGKGYFSFPDAGDWDVVAYLMSFATGYQSSVLEAWRDDGYFWNEQNQEVNFQHSHKGLTVCAAGHGRVSVPSEVFAKPLPPTVRAWLSYFWSRPVDSCAAWRRLLPAFTFGVVWYMIWEGIKRGWAFALGCAHFVIGGSPLPMWKITVTKRLSADLEADWGKYEYEPLTSFSGWRLIYHPVFLILYVGLGWIYLNYYWLFMKYLPPAIIVVTSVLIGVGIVKLISRLLPNQQQREAKRLDREYARREANIDQLALVRTYALSGTPQPAVPAPISIRLVWDGIKARHCKVYAKR